MLPLPDRLVWVSTRRDPETASQLSGHILIGMQAPEVKLVTESWTEIVARGEQLAEDFYARLFRLEPQLRALFPEDLTLQKEKLMLMLNQAVLSLHAAEELLPAVRSLGARHACYGVTPEHYKMVGNALLVSLEVCCGAGWNNELEIAWSKVYRWLSTAMIDAAEQAQSARSSA